VATTWSTIWRFGLGAPVTFTVEVYLHGNLQVHVSALHLQLFAMVAYGHAPDDSVMVRQDDHPKLLPLGQLYQPLDCSKPIRHDTRDAIRQAVHLVKPTLANTLKLRDNRIVIADPTGRLKRVTHSTLMHKLGYFGRNLPGLRVTSVTGPAPTLTSRMNTIIALPNGRHRYLTLPEMARISVPYDVTLHHRWQSMNLRDAHREAGNMAPYPLLQAVYRSVTLAPTHCLPSKQQSIAQSALHLDSYLDVHMPTSGESLTAAYTS